MLNKYLQYDLEAFGGYEYRILYYIGGIGSLTGTENLSSKAIKEATLKKGYDTFCLGLPLADELTLTIDLNEFDSSIYEYIYTSRYTDTQIGVAGGAFGVDQKNVAIVQRSDDNWLSFEVLFEGVQNESRGKIVSGSWEMEISFYDIFKRAHDELEAVLLADDENASDRAIDSVAAESVQQSGFTAFLGYWYKQHDLNTLSPLTTAHYLDSEKFTEKLLSGIECETNPANAINSGNSIIVDILSAWRRHGSGSINRVLTPFSNFTLYSSVTSGNKKTILTSSTEPTPTIALNSSDIQILRYQTNEGINNGFFVERNLDKYETTWELLDNFALGLGSKVRIVNDNYDYYIIFDQLLESNSTSSTESSRSYEATRTISPYEFSIDGDIDNGRIFDKIDIKTDKIAIAEDSMTTKPYINTQSNKANSNILNMTQILTNHCQDHYKTGFDYMVYNDEDVVNLIYTDDGEIDYLASTQNSLLKVHHNSTYHTNRTTSYDANFQRVFDYYATNRKIKLEQNEEARLEAGMPNAIMKGLEIFQTPFNLSFNLTTKIDKLDHDSIGRVYSIDGGINSIVEGSYLETQLSSNILINEIEIDLKTKEVKAGVYAY
jgi:hypothetical protein